MVLQTRFITVDDFDNYFQMDLALELGSAEKAIGFICRIEDRLESYINTAFNVRITREYTRFTDYQKLHYKLALLEQAIYIFKNSDLSVDSGYDLDRGEIGRPKDHAIAPNCKENLVLCGIWNRNIYKGYGYRFIPK